MRARVLEVADRAVPLHVELLTAPLEPGVELVEMGLGLGDVALEPGDVGALDATIEQLRERELLAVDELLQGDLDVLAHDAFSLLRWRRPPRGMGPALAEEETLDLRPIGHTGGRDERASLRAGMMSRKIVGWRSD
jgi:hypothetical protein